MTVCKLDANYDAAKLLAVERPFNWLPLAGYDLAKLWCVYLWNNMNADCVLPGKVGIAIDMRTI